MLTGEEATLRSGFRACLQAESLTTAPFRASGRVTMGEPSRARNAWTDAEADSAKPQELTPCFSSRKSELKKNDCVISAETYLLLLQQ